MAKKVRKMEQEDLIRKMMELNPNVVMKLSSFNRSALYVIGDPKELSCPYGYRFSEKYGITNKGNTTNSSFVSVSVVLAH